MGGFKDDCSEDDEEPQSENSEDELSAPAQSSKVDLQREQQITRTRNGAYRRSLPQKRIRKNRKVYLKAQNQSKPKKRTATAAASNKSKHSSIDLKKVTINSDKIGDTALESDIDEDECIPNGCKSIECFICSCRLSKIYNLRHHMAAHLDEASFEEETFKNSEIFNILNPHNRKIDSKTIKKFVIQEIQAKRYSQFYCILNEAAVELHISDSETDSDGAGDIIPHNNYRCELCKKNFDRRYKALFHQKTAHVRDELVVECDYCLKKFVCMNVLIHHLKTQCESDEKPVPCTERFMKFLLKVNLEYYANLAVAREQRKIRKVTEAPKSYSCSVCKKSFTRQEHLNRHSAVHLPDEMKFECSVCDRRFNRKDNMRSHMKTHTEEGTRTAESKKILCSCCGRSFSSKSNYVVHMRRHTGEKPYKCDVCGKGFPKSTDLNSHKITHTGEKNFVCIICKKAFARSAVLSKHMRVHNGPYPCTFCEKTFPKPSALTFHLKTHVAGRLCACLVCNEAFTTKSKLAAHFAERGHSNETKRVIVNKEPVVAVEAIDKLSSTYVSAGNKASNAGEKVTNDDPLEINEEERRMTKVKVPPNEVIQSVLLKSTSTVTESQEVASIGAQQSDNLMPPYSPIDNGFDDDGRYSDW